MAISDSSAYFQALQHPSKDRQGDILIAATDNFVKTPRPSQKEYERYGELFYSLIPSTNTSAKRLIAATLANSTYAPRLSIFYLALADISIAAPVLAFSQIFTPEDLQELIAKTTTMHHRIIATRTDLTAHNISALANTGDKVVALRLLNNQSITLAKEQNNLLRLISNSQSPQQERQEEKPLPIPKTSTKTMEEMLSLANKGGRLNAPIKTSMSKQSTQQNVVDFYDATKMNQFHVEFMEAAEQGDKIHMESIIHQHLNVSAVQCQKILNDFTGDTFAIVAKATGLEPLFALYCAKKIFSPLQQDQTLAKRFNKIYGILAKDVCIKGLKSWQVYKPTPAPEYVPQLQDEKPTLRKRLNTNNGMSIQSNPMASPAKRSNIGPTIGTAPQMPQSKHKWAS